MNMNEMPPEQKIELKERYYNLSKDVQRMQLAMFNESVEYNNRVKKWVDERKTAGLNYGAGTDRAKAEIKIIQDMVKETWDVAEELDWDVGETYSQARKEVIEEALQKGRINKKQAEDALQLAKDE